MNTKQIFQHITIFLLFVFLLLTTSCGEPNSSANANKTPVSGTTRLLLVPKAGTKPPSLAEMEATRKILDQRIQDMGLQEANSQVLTTNGLSIQIDLPSFAGDKDKQGTINNLLKTGLLEFWITGAIPLNVGDTLDPTQYTQYNPENKPAFTGTDLDPNSLGISQQQGGATYQINFAMKSDKATTFGTFTSDHINQVMTITLDKQIVLSATIRSAIIGPGQITGNFTHAEAQSTVNTLKHGALPVPLQIDSETDF
jgi:preprotein translocase subunit SecD